MNSPFSQKPVNEKHLQEDLEVDATEVLSQNSAKILVIDDEKHIVQLLRRHFEGRDFEIYGETDSNQALKKVIEVDPDVVISDIKMPDISGLEILEHIKKEIDHTIEVIIISAQGTVEELTRALRLGASDYLKKPFGLTQVELSVKRALSTRNLKLKNEEYRRELEKRLAKAQELNRRERASRKAMEYLTSTILDINRELRHSNLRLEKANRGIVLANRHKSEFLARMSHELRTPLNSILGFGEVLEDETFGELNEKQKQYISNILKSGRHLLSLINDILDISKVESGILDLSYESFNISQLVRESLQLVQGMARKKNIEVEIASCPPEEITLEADPQKFKQILFNLVSNAIKFSSPSSEVKVSWEKKKGQVAFHIEDKGIGIKEEFQPRIFQKFQQMDTSLAREYEGTGLGLALTKKLVVRHGGDIWFESTEGEGSTFSFSLPLEADPRELTTEDELERLEKLGNAPEAEGLAEIDEDGLHPVIHIDSEEEDIDLITHYLEPMGYEVKITDSNTFQTPLSLEIPENPTPGDFRDLEEKEKSNREEEED